MFLPPSAISRPSSASGAIRPPSLARASKTTGLCPRSARRSAVATPAIPPPTTATRSGVAAGPFKSEDRDPYRAAANPLAVLRALDVDGAEVVEHPCAADDV